ncbi:hypothetical protein M406DRAFT_69071 [Cryphonectria parasitica EP155]|uniref:Uncharacterized protein n=1 Tax=Cryphonectria parasitica (strain ATCC 38755 / EP155) TaxID=660469 RepID=A0A9P5CQ66_CRYP1|nr:uncharacterized protein M406DRAFT_69071 [Cryphonectria parasitica EP155]KAF3766893.1 hypothetical protein M406DRAFT_69071 [Cryphonectria parasitica EP155]
MKHINPTCKLTKSDKQRDAIIIAGFPAIGKSSLTKADPHPLSHEPSWEEKPVMFGKNKAIPTIWVSAQGDRHRVFDIDSADYKSPDGTDDFSSYIAMIMLILEQDPKAILLVCTKPGLTKEMRKRHLDYALVYPRRDLKDVWLARQADRIQKSEHEHGATSAAAKAQHGLYKFMEKKWDEWQDGFEQDEVTDFDPEKEVARFEFDEKDYLKCCMDRILESIVLGRKR